MRSIPLESINKEILSRFGPNAKGIDVTPKMLEEITGCRSLGKGTVRGVEIEALVPVPGTEVYWVNPYVTSREAEELHRKYFYDDPTCHTYRDTLYCVCDEKGTGSL